MFRVSFFSGDDLIGTYFYDCREPAESFIHRFIDLTDPLIGSNLSDLFLLKHDFTVCLYECETEVSDGLLISRYIVYKG